MRTFIALLTVVTGVPSSLAQPPIIVAGGGPPNGTNATAFALSSPLGAAVDSAGNIYVASAAQNRVYKIAGSTVTTFAGNGIYGYSGDGGPASNAELGNPSGIALDTSGNLYIFDSANCRIRKVSGGTISTIAGNGTCGYSGDGGPATGAEINSQQYQYFNYPFFYPYYSTFVNGLAVDNAGNVYIADFYDDRVRKVSGGIISTVAGNGSYGYSGDGGQATSAEIGDPSGLSVDTSGNLYIADYDNSRVRKVTAATGIITTVAGNGTYGYAGDGGPATSAEIYYPSGLAVDTSGSLYIADYYRVRKVAAATGIITTVAGNGGYGYFGDGGQATSAEITYPGGVAVDTSGNFYFADTNNYRIRKVTAATGVITTLAGNGTFEFSGDGLQATSAQLNPSGIASCNSDLYIADQADFRIRRVSQSSGLISTAAGAGISGYSGDGGLATGALLSSLSGVASDSACNLYIADTNNCRVRSVSASTGVISTLAGNGTCGYSGDGGPAINAELDASITAIAADNSGNVYIADNNRIRKISGGAINLVAGGGPQNGASAASAAVSPSGTAVDSLGNVYIADSNHNRVYVVSTGGAISTAAGNGLSGFSGDQGAAASSRLNSPSGVAVDSSGNVYIADSGNGRIRRISNGVISTFAGGGGGCSPGETDSLGDGCPATSGILDSPSAIAVDTSGNLYIADTYNYRIRKVTAATGIITTVAGNGTSGYSGDGGQATSAELNYPGGVAVDTSGNVYITDTYSYRVRKVTAATGIITTVAGNGNYGYSGDGGQATSAEIYYPSGLAVDTSGNLYIADYYRIRKVTAATGIITTVAGNGTYGYSGDGGQATGAELYDPSGLAVDLFGNLYIADTGNYRVREVLFSTGIISTIAGNGFASYSGDGGQAITAQFSSPGGLAVDSAGNLYISDSGNARVRMVSPGGIVTTFAGGGTQGSANGVTATNATLSNPNGIAVAAGSLFIEDTGTGLLRRVFGDVITTLSTFSNGGGGNGGVALDNSGNFFISDARDSVVREIMPPTVLIDTPQAGGTVSGMVTLAGWAIDNASGIGTAISSVQVSVDGVAVGSATYGLSRPDVCNVYPGRPGCPNVGYTYAVNASALGNGSHTITVSATDSSGTPYTSSASIEVIVVAGPPTVFIDAPANSSTISGTVTLSGWAINNASNVGTAIGSVQVKVDGTVVGSASYGTARPDVCSAFPGRPGCPDVGFTYQLNTALLTETSHVITVAATDTALIPDTGSATVTVTVAAAPPMLNIDSPASGGSISGLVSLSGWAIGNPTTPISSVQVEVDGAIAGHAIYGTSRPDVCNAFPGRPGCPNVGYAYQLDATKLAAGTHTLTVLATDADGNASPFSIGVNVPASATLPTINIDSPASGAVTGGTVTIAGWAINNVSHTGTAISQVQVALDGTLLGAATYGISRPDVCSAYPGRPGCPNVGFSYALNTSSVSSGSHRLCVLATDTDATPETGSTCIAIQVPGPFVYIDTPASGAGVSGVVTISGWAIDNTAGVGPAIANVQVEVDGAPVGNATYGISRQDVCNAYPGRAGCPYVGFTYALNTTILSSGSHTVTILATDSNPQPDAGSARVTITK